MNEHIPQLALFTITLRVYTVFGVTLMETICQWWNGHIEVLEVRYL